MPRTKGSKNVKKTGATSKKVKKSKAKPKSKPTTPVINREDIDYGVGSDDENQDSISIADDISNIDASVVAPAFDASTESYEYQPRMVVEEVIVRPEDRKTDSRMTIYEYAEVVGIRAQQLENGGVCYTDTGTESDLIKQAKKEISDKKCPLSIKRERSEGIVEIWHVNEMTMPY